MLSAGIFSSLAQAHCQQSPTASNVVTVPYCAMNHYIADCDEHLKLVRKEGRQHFSLFRSTSLKQNLSYVVLLVLPKAFIGFLPADFILPSCVPSVLAPCGLCSPPLSSFLPDCQSACVSWASTSAFPSILNVNLSLSGKGILSVPYEIDQDG